MTITKEAIIREALQNQIFNSKLFNHVWLVGSFAKDSSTENSDIDFLIDYNISEIPNNTLTDWAKAIDFFENKFNRTVQFISTEAFKKLGETKYGISIK